MKLAVGVMIYIVDMTNPSTIELDNTSPLLPRWERATRILITHFHDLHSEHTEVNVEAKSLEVEEAARGWS